MVFSAMFAFVYWYQLLKEVLGLKCEIWLRGGPSSYAPLMDRQRSVGIGWLLQWLSTRLSAGLSVGAFPDYHVCMQ